MRQVPEADAVRSSRLSASVPLIASIGSALEYYSFVIFILLIGPMSHVFFPAGNQTSNVLKTLAIFASSYLTAPLAGFVFGSLSDRIGRKIVLCCSIAAMGIASFLIGILPTYNSIGIYSCLLLLVLRLLQGVAQGTEITGAITFVAEHARPERRGLDGGLLFFGIGLGASLSTFVVFIIHAALTPAQVQAWGWRIPFLLSSFLTVIGVWLRSRASESPLFLEQQHIFKAPITMLCRKHPIKILQGISLVLYGACLVTFGLYLPHFIATSFQYSMPSVLLATSYSFGISAFFLPLFGWLSDIIGRKRLFCSLIIVTAVIIPTLFSQLIPHSGIALYGFIMVYYILLAGLASCYVTLLAELFDTSYRYTGVGVTYSAPYSLASLAPLAIAGWVTITQNPDNAMWFLTIAGVITLIAAFTLQDKTAKALR